MISNLQLPNSEEFDVDTTLTLTRRQTKETLALLSAYPERYRWIQPHTTFDYIAPKDPAMYDLRFRVVRFRISGGCYETVYTNLDSETFPIGTIKELYRLRWGIETSFRELKYTIGLSCLHGKKTDFLLQEVFARLIPSLSTEQSGCPFHLTWIRPSSSSLASSSLRRSFCSTSRRNRSFCGVSSSFISYLQSQCPF